jgi:hypothetical protein
VALQHRDKLIDFDVNSA